MGEEFKVAMSVTGVTSGAFPNQGPEEKVVNTWRKKCMWSGWVGEAAPGALGSRPFPDPTVIKVLVAGYSAARPEEKARN